jgi:hypothetical protein
MKFDALLGLHGIVLRSDDPSRDARRWRRALGLAPPRKALGGVTVGVGPEFFVTLRQAAPDAPPGVEEIHVAVSGLRGAPGAVDALGGRMIERRIGRIRLVVREFIAEPRQRPRRRARGKVGARRETAPLARRKGNR